MIEPYIRPSYQFLIGDNLAILLGKFLSPNGATILGVLFGLSIIPALLFNHVLLSILFLILSGTFDTLDGTIARYYQKHSDYGTALDIIGDRIVEFSIILGLFLISPESRGLICLSMLGSILICVTSFLIVGIFTPSTTEKNFHYSSGLIERLEAFIFFAFMIIFPDYFFTLAYIFTVLTFLTAFLRFVEFKIQLKCPK